MGQGIRRSVVVALALSLAAACSSTKETSDTAREPGTTAAPAPETSARPASTAAAGSPTASRESSRPGAAPARSSVARGAPNVPTVPGRVSQGVTDTEIKIGVSISSDFSASAAAFGLNESGQSNTQQSQVQAIAKYINAHGGIAQRKLVPVIHDISSTGTFDVEAQAACAAWTEDDKVFAALGWLYDRDTMLSCLAKRNTPLLKSSYQVFTNRFANRYRNFFYQHDFLFGDHWHVYIDGLVAQGFLKPANRIGLIRLDEPDHAWTAENVLEPRLRKHGLKLTDQVAIPPFHNAAEAVGQTNAALGNAVLRFRGAGIDRVIYIDIGNVLMWFFGVQAESQGYRPDHGMTSLNVPSYIQDNVAASQLDGARGVGWWPVADTSEPTGDNAGEQTCERLLRQAKLPTEAAGMSYCSRLFFLKHALDRAKDITPAGLRASVDRLGRGFSSALTHMTSYRAGRFDGVGGVRYFRFDTGCTCFKYHGPWRSIL